MLLKRSAAKLQSLDQLLASLTLARGEGCPLGWVGIGGVLDCDGKIASWKAFFKKNHINSCRNIGNPENHQDS